MNALGTEIRNALKTAARETGAGKLTRLGQRVGEVFNQQLRGFDIFATDQQQFGGLLHTVVDQRGIAIMYHLGGTLQRIDETIVGDRIYYRIIGGAGRAFKFMPHAAHAPVGRDDFFGAGFPYRPETLSLSEITGGTVALVRGSVQPTFSIDSISRVTADGVDDMRIFRCGGELIDKTQLLFEEMISGVNGEWDKIFLLLHS